MGFRASVMTGGAILIVLSYFIGDWSAWIGAFIVFVGAILHFIDKE